MKLLKFIVLSLCLFVSDYVCSQTVDEVRRVKTVALEVFDKYVSEMKVLYQKGPYQGEELFKLLAPDATLINDIIPDSTCLGRELTGDEYLKILNANVKSYNTEFKRLELKFPQRNGDKWVIECQFEQIFNNFRGQKKKRYPKWSFRKRLVVSMDTAHENEEIMEISLCEGESPLTEYFVVMTDTVLKLKVDQFELEREEYGKLLPKPMYSLSDISVDSLGYFQELKPVADTADVRFYSFHKNNVNIASASLEVSPICGGFGIDKSLLPDVDQTGFAVGAKGLYGFSLKHSYKSALFLNLGLNIDWYNNKLSGRWGTSYRDVDSDGDAYLRKIAVSAFDETAGVLSVNVPVSLECMVQMKAKKPTFLSIEGGFYAGYRLVTHNYSFDAKYTGVYDYFGGVEFDHYYDYGTFPLSEANTSYSLPAKKIDMGVLVNVGVAREISKDRLIKLYVGYRQGFSALASKVADDFCLTRNKHDYTSPIETSSNGLSNLSVGVSFVKVLR